MMRIPIFFTATLAAISLATASLAQDVDHGAHHPDTAKPSAAAPPAPAPASPSMAMPERMQCMSMMGKLAGSAGKPAEAGAPKAGEKGIMSEEHRKHCAEMMAQMPPTDPDKAPKK
jgi:hypothetical protein